MPSPMPVNRSSLEGSMGRTCLQSPSFSRALLIQFTKATFSSSAGGRQHTSDHSRHLADPLQFSPSETEPPSRLLWGYKRSFNAQNLCGSVQMFCPRNLRGNQTHRTQSDSYCSHHGNMNSRLTNRLTDVNKARSYDAGY